MSSSNSNIQVLLLSQNIGSIECNTEELTPENQQMTLAWTQSVATFLHQELVQSPIDVVVIHLQEIGGKKFNQAFNDYLRTTIHQCYPDAAWCSGLLGPNQDDTATFTAMGTVLFLSSRVIDRASIWSFSTNEFVAINAHWNKQQDGCYFSGSKFSNVGSSRKGYLLTTLRIGNNSKPLNFVNLHLLNDGDNALAASQPHPSEYVGKRVDAILETMTQAPFSSSSSSSPNPPDPIFLFGDLNLRLDTYRLKELLETKFNETITLEKKKIKASDPVWDFLASSQSWPILQELDYDAALIRKTVFDKTGWILHELTIHFGPTYLLEDDPSKQQPPPTPNHESCAPRHGNDAALKACYKRYSRFPAWCDRVWFNESGASIMDKEQAVYSTASLHPMDHLPVYLKFSMEADN